MSSLKCPFAAPLVSGQYSCEHAASVVRRGGAEIDCRSEPAFARCTALFEHMKCAALPAFDVEDDLLSMPHSVLQKIQYGGLAGLVELVRQSGADASVANVAKLAEAAESQAGSVDAIAYERLVESMTSFKLRRRGAR